MVSGTSTGGFVMLTCAFEPKLNVGGFCAFTGLDVTDAVRATPPVKPPKGVTVTVDVFPVVAPGTSVTCVAPMEKLEPSIVMTPVPVAPA
jgi:hypothetical protein